MCVRMYGTVNASTRQLKRVHLVPPCHSKEESQATTDAAKRVTSADFSFQFSAAREHQKVEKKVFNILCEISIENKKKDAKLGILCAIDVQLGSGPRRGASWHPVGTPIGMQVATRVWMRLAEWCDAAHTRRAAIGLACT